MQFVEKTFSQCSSEITAEFALPCLIRPSNWEKHAQHTHTQTQDWTIHFDWCSQSVTLLFIAKSTNTAQTYPSITLAAAYPKPKEVHYKIKLQRFQRYKIHFKKSLSLPHGNHLLSSIITRPRMTRFSGACICHLISYCQKAILFTFFCSVYQKNTTNYFVIFLDWSWRLEWDLLKNHYKHLRGFLRVSWRASC